MLVPYPFAPFPYSSARGSFPPSREPTSLVNATTIIHENWRARYPPRQAILCDFSRVLEQAQPAIWANISARRCSTRSSLAKPAATIY